MLNKIECDAIRTKCESAIEIINDEIHQKMEYRAYTDLLECAQDLLIILDELDKAEARAKVLENICHQINGNSMMLCHYCANVEKEVHQYPCRQCIDTNHRINFELAVPKETT